MSYLLHEIEGKRHAASTWRHSSQPSKKENLFFSQKLLHQQRTKFGLRSVDELILGLALERDADLTAQVGDELRRCYEINSRHFELLLLRLLEPRGCEDRRNAV